MCKMLFGLQTLWFILVTTFLCAALACKPTKPGWRKGKEHCTNIFKNRTIRLESLFYKSYWFSYSTRTFLPGVCPSLKYAQRNEILDHTKLMSWRLHDCGPDCVCLENMGLRYHWLEIMKFKDQDRYLNLVPKSDVDRDASIANRFQIFCDSCKQHRRCQIYGSEYTYSDDVLNVADGISMGEALSLEQDQYDWDIVMLLPMERRVAVQTSICNIEKENLTVTLNVRQKVGISKTSEETHGLNLEFTASMGGIPLPWKYEGKVTHTNLWRNENFEEEEHETTVTINGASGKGITVKQGWRVDLNQFTVGRLLWSTRRIQYKISHEKQLF